MNISFQKQWMFGQFLLCADNRFAAKHAYEILRKGNTVNGRSGRLKLSNGKEVQWVNVALRPDYRFANRRARSL